MIDALFGSKTRVKLLHLFMNNPGRSFYVREITRLIDEQINSVRRELANMLQVGVIISDSSDNKLYYEVNQNYAFYRPLKEIFGEIQSAKSGGDNGWSALIKGLPRIKLAIGAGILAPGSSSKVDLLLVGDVPLEKVKVAISTIERHEGRELNYSIIGYDEFFYRLSVRDRFVMEVLNGKHRVLVDKNGILNK